MGSPDGVIVLNKPSGITSREAVDVACSHLGTRQIGHCGTLDPLAGGVLVLVVGRARRLQEMLARSRKTYRAVVRLGARSETDDAEGPIEVVDNPRVPSAEEVRTIAARFVGTIEQRPPNYSAVKVGGKRLYDLARQGHEVEAPVRQVHVYSLVIERYEYPDVHLEVSCAGGTYVRSIARDLGEILGVGGYLLELTRTEAGGFSVEQGVAPEAVTEDGLLPVEEALRSFQRVDIAASQATRLANGATVQVRVPAEMADEEQHLFGWVNGRAVALLRRQGPDRVRSGRLLVTVEELEQLAEAELQAEDTAPQEPRY